MTAAEAAAVAAAGELVWVVVRVLRAELSQSVTVFGEFARMNPYVVVEWHSPDGSVTEVTRTPADVGGHMRPRWNHTAREQPYMGSGCGDTVDFKVLHGRFGGFLAPALCGGARALADDLLEAVSTPTGSCKHNATPTMELPLLKDDAEVGSIVVQALLVRTGLGDDASLLAAADSPAVALDDEDFFDSCDALSRIDPGTFQEPAGRLGVSGGTARFYRLQLEDGSSLSRRGRGRDYFIGKDLSHAKDEVLFYETALRLSRQKGCGGLGNLLPFMFDYTGIYKCAVEGSDALLDMLVMRNLRDGCTKLRMLDLKIGQFTASAGWQGKSRMRAYRQAFVDGITNSSEEGFRLEGFDSTPPALASMDPLLDLSTFEFGAKSRKKALRIMFQRMGAQEILRHFFDVHQMPADPGSAGLASVRTPSEVAELVHHEILCRLLLLAFACRSTLVPQKWIGSSIALGFECGVLPRRSKPEEELRREVRANIFDWGRSELNTLESHMGLSDSEQRDRARFWGYYVDGIDRLLFEALRAYWHRFGSWRRWAEATVTVYDFDSHSENDFIGRVTVPLRPTGERRVVLLDAAGAPVQGWRQRRDATLTYSVEWRWHPYGSRLQGAWRVHLIRAANLPACDLMKGQPKSDPFAVLTARTVDGRSFRQQTSVMQASLDPEWRETLELTVAATRAPLEDALISIGSHVGDGVAADLVSEPITGLLPAETAGKSEVDAALAAWTARLNRAASVASEQVCHTASQVR